ncbi:MAG: lysophospholipid acyltransferase family protein [Archangium sp.]|nr:lysophospholipid acyltransferase family protein [Archangium sp.]MDP3154010.1 lysophospholipid acyltransferase family protein [Archangium sp.]MDP3570087.1 lysophospholipid acyltransferase family protein [Archangium sp.]
MPSKPHELLRSAFSGAAAVGITGAMSSVVSALSFLDERAPDRAIFVWADSILKASGVRTECRGLENLPPGNFVLCVNHQSNFDALVLFRHIRRHMRYVAKAQLLKVPVFGPALRRAGNIFVDRTGGAGDREKLMDAAAAVRDRVSVVFFAEGTRSDDGILRPFKKGAAAMAIEAGVPLIPAALAGTHRILEKGSVIIRPRPSALLIGEPIPTKGLTADDREALTQKAHAVVAALLEQGNQLVTEMER